MMTILAHVLLGFVAAVVWFLLVLFVLPRDWYNYRIVQYGSKFNCEKRLKFIGLFWHCMWVDEYLSDEFDSYEAAKAQLDAYLAPVEIKVYKYNYNYVKKAN